MTEEAFLARLDEALASSVARIRRSPFVEELLYGQFRKKPLSR